MVGLCHKLIFYFETTSPLVEALHHFQHLLVMNGVLILVFGKFVGFLCNKQLSFFVRMRSTLPMAASEAAVLIC